MLRNKSNLTDEEDVQEGLAKLGISNYKRLEDIFAEKSGESTSTDYEGMDEDPVDFYSPTSSPLGSPSTTPLSTPLPSPEKTRKKSSKHHPKLTSDSRTLSWTNMREKLTRKPSKNDVKTEDDPGAKSPTKLRRFRRGTK